MVDASANQFFFKWLKNEQCALILYIFLYLCLVLYAYIKMPNYNFYLLFLLFFK